MPLVKNIFGKVGFGKKDLHFRLSLIPDSSSEIIRCAWLDEGSVEYTEEQYNRAVRDLKHTCWLVARGTKNTLVFKDSYADFNLAVSCARIMYDIFTCGGVYNGSAEVFYEVLCEALNKLKEEQKYTIRLRYGFEDGNFYTYKNAGKELGISEYGVKYRVAIALPKLEQYMKHVDVK